jgi:hypothetical protein
LETNGEGNARAPLIEEGPAQNSAFEKLEPVRPFSSPVSIMEVGEQRSLRPAADLQPCITGVSPGAYPCGQYASFGGAAPDVPCVFPDAAPYPRFAPQHLAQLRCKRS